MPSEVEKSLIDLRAHASDLKDVCSEPRLDPRAESFATHARNLEEERPHLPGHIPNLERELADLRSRWTVRQRLALRWRRMFEH